MGTLYQVASAGFQHKRNFPIKDEDPWNYPDIWVGAAPTGSYRNNNAAYRHVGIPGVCGLAPPSDEFIMGAWMCYSGNLGPNATFSGWAYDPGPPVDLGEWRSCISHQINRGDGVFEVWADDNGPWVGGANPVLLDTVSCRVQNGIIYRVNHWMHIGMYVIFGGSNNFDMVVYIDGQEVQSYSSGANELMTIPNLWSCGKGVRTTSGWVFHYFDSFYIKDVTGEGNQVPPALRAIRTHIDGAGSSTQWTPDSGSNWDRVDDTNAAPDDNTSYVETTSTASDLDLYTHEALVDITDLPYSYDFEGNVLVETRFENVDDGEVTEVAYEHAVDVSGSQSFDGTFSNTTLDTYEFAQSLFPQQPDTSAWNLADYNAAEFGYRSK